VLAPRGGLAGRVARCDDDDEYERPDRGAILDDLLPIAVSTVFLGAIAALGKTVGSKGRTERERMRQEGLERRERLRQEGRDRRALCRAVKRKSDEGA
jgi:hypothetical protein